ncbi:MAG: alpha-mannosidase [Clostridia bacterium]|nr:alpha-mannosidase [Clostridia bacterium]
MTNEKQLQRVLNKAARLEKIYDPYLFRPVAEIGMEGWQTTEHLRTPPTGVEWKPLRAGDVWGGEWENLWLRGSYTVPEALKGQPLWLLPRLGGWEGFLFLNDLPHAIFTNKYTVETHGNHYAARVTAGAPAGETLRFDMEYYAGHYIPGCQPYEDTGLRDCRHTYEKVEICLRDEEVLRFLIDLRVINSLVRALPADSFRRGDLVRGLYDVTQLCSSDPENDPDWRSGIAAATERLQPLLAAKNADSAPITAVIGHSHMDTAWLWPVDETIRKCARTYANAVRLMDEYPEFKFFQSSAYHTEMIRRHYPALFEKIREKIHEGRYENGGAVWVECDCNMVSGESMVRQFLWGQKYNEKHFGTRSNNFWLPDTFGYSAAIPQIMQKSGVRYFFTTKLSWNDTNVFPYDTFIWEGLDGSRVFTHFNATHCEPDPECLTRYTVGNADPDFTQESKQKSVSRRKLIAYAYGDGGGGPQFEHMELVRREADLDGCPRTAHRRVDEFAEEMEREAQNVPVHAGELYLELHRGTLTNRHQIKRNNRKGEVTLHDLELLTVLDAVDRGVPADDTAIRPHMETLLKNQFHDILPGSSITRVHEESIAEMREMIEAVRARQKEVLSADGEGFTVLNPLPFARQDTVYLPGEHAQGQTFTDVFGKTVTAFEGAVLPPMTALPFTAPAQPDETSFVVTENGIETPYYKVIWDENGGFASLIDKRVDRELRNGMPLNTFVLAEDVPWMWDNWDVDPDTVEDRFKPTARLLSRVLVSVGASQARFHCTYRLTAESSLCQDVVFFANRPEIEFHTRIDWNDKHRFLKVAFDTDIRTRFASHEIQFGHIERPTTRNNSLEQAMFEVCNHKYTDLSEPRYGCAVLNDCKYGVSVRGGSIRLSLHKAGCRPDSTGDSGVHDVTYAFLPHVGGLSAETVVQPAYRLNNPPRVFTGSRMLPEAPVTVDASNIMIESVKPLHETAERAMVVRLYECEGGRTSVKLRAAPYITAAYETDLLEENPVSVQNEMVFGPFEIKTLILHY